MLAHDSVFMPDQRGQHGQILVIPDIAKHHARISLEHPQLCPLDRRALNAAA
ncbi:MAG: hypothetical protein Q8K82_06145 [Gemmatimonadaceae bacterium]|nr:hypothetical protein [Gemmatimonadaceae bacterium]